MAIKIPAPALDEQLAEAIHKKGIPHIPVEADANGRVIADKTKDPELYDWAENG